MGRQQFEVLKGVVRRTLQRRFCKFPRSATEGVVIEGAKPVQCPPNSNCGSGLNPRSQFSSSVSPSSSSSCTLPERVCKDFASAPISVVLLENSQSLRQEGLEVFFPSHLRRGLYINFSLGPSFGLTPGSNAVRVFGSIPTLSRGFACVTGQGSKAEEKVGESVAADGPRGEGQGGDEGLTASVSGREIPLKKPRRRKALGVENDREVGFGADAPKKDVTKAISDSKELESAVSNFQSENVAPRNTADVRRKRNTEAVTLKDASLKGAVVEHEQSNVHIEDRPPPDVQSFPASPILGMDSAEEIPAPTNVPAGASEKILHAFSSSGWSDSDLEKHSDCKKGGIAAAGSKTFGAGISLNEQELRMTSFTSVVEEHLKELHKQNTAKSTGKSMGHAISGNQNEHVKPGASLKSGGGSAVDSHVEGADYTDPTKVYRILQGSRGGRPFQGQEKGKLNSIFYRFSVSGWVSDQALSLYINSKFFPTASSKFRKFFMHRSSPELRSYVVAKGPTNDALQFLFPIFAEFCIQEFSDEIRRYRELVSTADMTKPDAWYPFARAMKRKVIYHKGPTNSGKTYKALKRLMEGQSGIYCSPLRLLAMEVFDTVNMQGVYCNLHTGQEKKDVPFANHLACTIEMCYLNKQWEVAVIDEIQMMSDEYRGWAWTRAFLGLQADEIHVCGDPSALPLIRNLCAGTGDELVENEYERFKPLKVSEESLRGDFRNIQAGDCIVAFSRRDIFDIKREVELATKHRCCVVYGALPPETRTQQAKLFNEQDNGYDVLVASDAIGMGLNLNIRRVVFFSLDKFDGDSKKPVPPAQVKQIAGRAGRRGSIYPEGVTTTFFSQDLSYLGSSLVQDFEPSTAAGLFPVYEQVELFASQLPNENFAKLLERFSETCKLDGAYFLCRYDNLKRVANMLEKVKGLSLEDRFNFCFAPVNVRDPQSMGALYRYATAFSQKIPVHVEMGVPASSARDEFELLDLEARHQVLSMYLWLSQHFPGDLFPQKEEAGEMASQIAVLLGQSLVQSSRRWSKRKLPPTHNRGRPPPNMGTTFNRKNTSWNAGTRKVGTAENVVRV